MGLVRRFLLLTISGEGLQKGAKRRIGDASSFQAQFFFAHGAEIFSDVFFAIFFGAAPATRMGYFSSLTMENRLTHCFIWGICVSFGAALKKYFPNQVLTPICLLFLNLQFLKYF